MKLAHRRGRWLLALVCGLPIVLAAGGFASANGFGRRSYSYRFLSGAALQERRVGRILAVDSDSEAAVESTYALPATFSGLCKQAEPELVGLGFSRTRWGADFAEWRRGTDWVTLLKESSGTGAAPRYGSMVICATELTDGPLEKVLLFFAELHRARQHA